MSYLVVIPTYNERDNISQLVPKILAHGDAFHILIVDDNSPDGTGELAEELARQEPRVHVLHRPGKLGLGTAYVAGFRWGLDFGAELIFEMDADFSHDPAMLPVFVEEIGDCDLVLGSRYVPGGGVRNWPLPRRLMSQGGSLYARTILGVPIRDLTGGFKCFRRQVLESLPLDEVQTTGYAFQIEMTYRTLLAGFRVKEIPIIFVDRVQGTSKMSRRVFLEAVIAVWRLRFSLPRPHQPFAVLPPAAPSRYLMEGVNAGRPGIS
ncbi:MAG: polyprenol monophosphomannose synthase [Anaerolineae bacterium]|nr:polyprenol monophosphomannose synthase [Anaerolineae bacterium]